MQPVVVVENNSDMEVKVTQKKLSLSHPDPQTGALPLYPTRSYAPRPPL